MDRPKSKESTFRSHDQEFYTRPLEIVVLLDLIVKFILENLVPDLSSNIFTKVSVRIRTNRLVSSWVY